MRLLAAAVATAALAIGSTDTLAADLTFSWDARVTTTSGPLPDCGPGSCKARVFFDTTEWSVVLPDNTTATTPSVFAGGDGHEILSFQTLDGSLIYYKEWLTYAGTFGNYVDVLSLTADGGTERLVGVMGGSPVTSSAVYYLEGTVPPPFPAPAPVPEPSQWALFAASLGLMGFVRWGKR